MNIVPPPTPFLGAKDLNQRYADNIRKLSNAPMLQDGDVSFSGVDTFMPAHELPPGMVADAINKRFEDGRMWPRNGVNSQPWGFIPGESTGGNVCAGGMFPNVGVGGVIETTVGGFVVGQTYYFQTAGNAALLSTASYIAVNRVIILPGSYFVATQTSYILQKA